MYRLTKLISRLEYLEGKRLSLNDISKMTGVHRTVLSKLLHGTGNVTSGTITKVATAFFWSFRKHQETLTDEELYQVILSELLTSSRPKRLILTKRESNAIKRGKAADFDDFPKLRSPQTEI